MAKNDTLRLPLNVVALIWLRCPRGAEEPGLLLPPVGQETAAYVVLLDNGDFLEGVVLDLDAQKKRCRVEAAKQVREVPFASIAALAFRSNLLTPGLPNGPYAQCGAAGRQQRASVWKPPPSTPPAKRSTVRRCSGLGCNFPSSAVALQVRQGKAVYLSDLEPSKYEHTPFLGVSWPYVKDGSVAGRSLRLTTGHARQRVGTARP